MVTIGCIPGKVKGFFGPLRAHFGGPAWRHFWLLVLALTVSRGATIDRLTRVMRSPVHRTKHGEFLWKSQWDDAWVVRAIALDTLRRLYRRHGGACYLILDDTQLVKRGKKMEAVGRIFHHATKRYCTGHTVLKVCLWYRGVVIPWGSWLYVKREHAPKLGVPFRKLTELAAEAVLGVGLAGKLAGLRVVVLFDAYYLCPAVVAACRARGWHFVGVGKSNRNFRAEGKGPTLKLGRYGRNLLGRKGKWHSVRGPRKSGEYRLAERAGVLGGLGEVKVVFSRRRGERKVVALVTDDLRAAARRVVADYLKRWSIEQLIKDQKQHLGLGDYRLKRYAAVVRHLRLADCAHACLTHLGLKELRAPGEQGHTHAKQNVLRLPTVSQLKDRMRQVVWQDRLEDVIRHSHEKAVIRRLERLLAA